MTQDVSAAARFFELTADLCCTMTLGGELIDVNAAWSRAFSGALGRPLTETLAEILHADDREAAMGAFAELGRGAPEAVFEARAVGRDAAVRWLRFRAARFEGDARVYCAATDITKVVEAEDRLRQTEDIDHQILDAVPDMVLVKGPKSKIVWANKAFREHYGMTAEELRGIVDAPFADPDVTQQYVKADAHVFETGETLHIPSEPALRYDGAVHFHDTVKSALRGPSGEVIMTVGIAHDITAEHERITSERLAREEAAKAQLDIIERQRGAIQAMATPILEIWAGVLAMPLIGAVDSARAARMTEALLEAIVRTRTRFTIVDLTGMDAAEPKAAGHILKLVKAAGLLGSSCVLSGISPAVGMTMAAMGTDLGDLRTFGTLRAALWYVLQRL